MRNVKYANPMMGAGQTMPTRCRRHVTLAMLLLALVGCRPAAPIPVAADLPAWKFKDHNLVFVSFDALQAAHVGSLGNPRKVTPTIDAFARIGVSFTNAFSVASWTVPST